MSMCYIKTVYHFALTCTLSMMIRFFIDFMFPGLVTALVSRTCESDMYHVKCLKLGTFECCTQCYRHSNSTKVKRVKLLSTILHLS